MSSMLSSVSGDLFVGETSLFFEDPRYALRSPYRLETKPDEVTAASFDVRAFNTDLVVLSDSRVNAAKVLEILYASDVGGDDLGVPAHDPDNAGRWTNLVETSDGSHWSKGECRKKTRKPAHKPKRVTDQEEAAIARLYNELPKDASDAVRDGRGIVISRTNSLFEYIWGETTPAVKYDLTVVRIYRSFNNYTYVLCRRKVGYLDIDVAAVLIVGRVWPKEVDNDEPSLRPVLTVARKHGGSGGGHVFCIVLGTRLANRLAHMTLESVAKSKRHYEGYFSDREYESCLKGKQMISVPVEDEQNAAQITITHSEETRATIHH